MPDRTDKKHIEKSSDLQSTRGQDDGQHTHKTLEDSIKRHEGEQNESTGPRAANREFIPAERNRGKQNPDSDESNQSPENEGDDLSGGISTGRP